MPAPRVTVEDASGAIGVPSGGLVSVINRGITEGWSQRFSIKVARSLDLSFRDSTFRELWRTQEAEYSRASQVLSHPPDLAFDPSHVTANNWGRAGAYYYWITLYHRVIGTGEIIEEPMLTSSMDLLSPDEAVAQMMQTLDEAETPEETGQGFTRLGASVYAITTNAGVA